MPINIVRPHVNPDAKFVDEDVTPELLAAAEAYAADYNGSFAFMRDMRASLENWSSLSTPKARGVLNCMRAEILRAEKPVTVVAAVASNRYATYISGKLRFFKVNTPEEGRWAGYTFVEELFGSPGAFHRVSIKDRAARNGILAAIAGDGDALARFGIELGACGMCGSPLTDEESRALGIGPVCRNKNL